MATTVTTSPRRESVGKDHKMAESLLDMEERMREEIRQLQEQRAAAMMNEIIDLQRERDIAVGRVKTLKKTVEELTLENVVLKKAIGNDDLADRLTLFERSMREERLVTSNLKKKLKKAKEQNETLVQKLHKLAEHNVNEQLVTVSSGSPNRLGLDKNIVMLQREKSQSMNDLKSTEKPKEQERGAATPNYQRSASLKTSNVLSPLLTITNASPATLSKGVESSTTPQTYSPTVIPRRYKLAAAACRDSSTQTDVDNSAIKQQKFSSSDNPSEVLLERANIQIARLIEEKKKLEDQLSEEITRRGKDTDRHKRLNKTCEILQTECSVLRDSLTEFSRWVRQKIQLAEEDMDIFKVVYSLHGSLSQETATLNDLQGKLGSAEQKVQRLEAANKHLTELVSQAEDRQKQTQNEIGMLRAKLSLLTPSPLHSPVIRRSSPSNTRKGSPTGGKKRVGASYKPYKHSSPRLRHLSPLAHKVDSNTSDDIV